MPLSLLLCEGRKNSPDLRLLRALLRDFTGRIEAGGAKAHLSMVLQFQRDQGLLSAVIQDGDWEGLELASWTEETTAQRWEVKGNWRGWQWRRKEVENYLIDPEVIARALCWSDAARSRYASHLAELMAGSVNRTAARIAISSMLPEYDLELAEAKNFSSDDADAVGEEITARVLRARASSHIDLERLLERWRENCQLLQPGAACHRLALFSGKELLKAFANRRGIKQDNDLKLLADHTRLIESVMDELRRADDAHEWLPEWRSLREAVLQETARQEAAPAG